MLDRTKHQAHAMVGSSNTAFNGQSIWAGLCTLLEHRDYADSLSCMVYD